MARLKVFRTPIGFHDAYVAAPSRKAALAAWGADVDLFARAAAEEVTDPALMSAPLAAPGSVIRVVRGTAEEHLAALPDTPMARKKPGAAPGPPAKRKPKPTRNTLTAAEDALEQAEADHKARLRDLAEREATLARERRELERDHTRELERLEKRRDDAKAAYDQAMADWRT